MRIVQTPVRFYPYVGGVESFVYELSKALKNSDHEVKVICSDEGQNGSTMDVKALPYWFKVANTNITPSLPFVLKRESYDVMHTHMPTPYSADVSTYISKFKEKPVVLTYHNDITADNIFSFFSSAYNRALLPPLLRRVDCVTVSTDSYKKKLEMKFHEVKGKTVVIPPGVDTERFKPASKRREKRLFFLSVLDEFHRYKGLDYLIEAVNGLDVELIVGGGGKLLEEYKNKSGENVRFLGRISDEEKIELYQSSDMFVLPSISAEQEGFGIVALEALACGTPVIITDIVGIAGDVKKYDCGMVVPPRDMEALREAIIDGMSEEKRRNARELALKYSWRKIGERFERLYERVIG